MDYREVAREAMVEMADEIKAVSDNLTKDFNKIVEEIVNCEGRLVVCGMGKSGLIGKKMVATFASTGTPSFFLHPAEAFHGDLGMVKKSDIVILISYSGETEEVLKVIPSLKSFGNKIISICGNKKSSMVKNSDYFISMKISKEVCPNNLAPTTSTLANLAVGDALAVALIKARDFQPQDFAVFHPGGSLGRRLLTKVKDTMRKRVPTVDEDLCFTECMIKMTEGKAGLAVVVDENDKVIGIVTDGDIRRMMLDVKKKNNKIIIDESVKVKDFMTKRPHTISPTEKVAIAEDYMMQNKIKALIVVNDKNNPIGIVQIYD